MATAAKTSSKASKAIPKENFYRGTGRRKEAVARVRLYPGTGEVTVNNKTVGDYFGTEYLQALVKAPFGATETVDRYNVIAAIAGGGVAGQAEALRHAIARALLLVNEDFRDELRKAGFLTRDQRAKERRKYGLKKARKAPQFSKR